jgi:predicted nucleic acid-binding protein
MRLVMRAVTDTNVIAGAMLTSGLNRKVFRACLTGKVKPLVGTALFLEYEDLVRRPGLFARSQNDFPESPRSVGRFSHVN